MVNNTIQQENSYTKAAIIEIYMKDGVLQKIIKDNLREEKKKVGVYGKINKEGLDMKVVFYKINFMV
jgi:hypothetical protein